MLGANYLNPAALAGALTDMGIPTTKRQAYRVFEEPGFPVIRVRGKLYCRKESLVNWLEAKEPKNKRRH